jgi:hypothetical protein
MNDPGRKLGAYLALFTSAGTLICCALPALFVALGFGATFAALVSNVPQLIWLSKHKNGLFLLAGILLLLSFGARCFAPRAASCAADGSCEVVRDGAGKVLWLALVIYLIGAFFAFAAPALV